jgi:hypothetical protein
MNDMRTFILLISIFVCTGSCRNSSDKSFRPGQLWYDNNGVPINAHGGGILWHDGVYYWYGEHKVGGEIGNTAQVGVHVYSSRDLYNWTDEGIALKVEEDTNSVIRRGCVLERPKVIFNNKTGKFVMWFHLELKGRSYEAARSGVAVSDKPVGPFTFKGDFRPNAGHWPENVQEFHKMQVHDSVKARYGGAYGNLPAHPDSLNLLGRDFQNGQMARDMTLFTDEDGTAYHFYASEENSTLHISLLTDDYLSCSGKYARFFVERYMEAPAICKTSKGEYFFIGSDCTGWSPNAARSARASGIWGPWTELGNPCTGEDSSLTFHSQGTFILPVQGMKDAFIFMADRWNPKDAVYGRYVWLPVRFDNGRIILEWFDEWDLSVFGQVRKDHK